MVTISFAATIIILAGTAKVKLCRAYFDPEVFLHVNLKSY
jgi:hypothetical protein